MKIRQGFVSNSSSSSFVVLGFPFKDAEFTEEVMDSLYSEDLRVLHGSDGGVADGVVVLGFDIASFDECGCSDSAEMSLNDLNEKLRKVTDILKKLNIEPKEEPKFYSGTRAC